MQDLPSVEQVAALRDRLTALGRRVRDTGTPAALALAEEVSAILGLLDGAGDDAAASVVPHTSGALRGQKDRLHAVAAVLGEAQTPDQVTAAIVDQGIRALDADAGVLVLLAADRGVLTIARGVGYSGAVLDRWAGMALTAPDPLAEAARTRRLISLDLPVGDVRAPGAGGAGAAMTDATFVAVPLVSDGEVLGALGLVFTGIRSAAAPKQAFLRELARLSAQALLRARTLQAQRAIREEVQATQRWLRFLAETSSALADTLDYEATLDRIAHLAVPALADLCAVFVRTASGTIERVSFAHIDPAVEQAVREGRSGFPVAPHGPHPVARAMRSGRPVVAREVTEEDLDDVATSPQQAVVLRRLGLQSYMCVPLIARGRILGCITFMSADPGRRYGPSHLSLAEEIATRAALAADNARLYDEAREALRVRDEFFSAVSHDLNTPLTAIKGLAQVLTRRLKQNGMVEPPRLAEGLTAIDTAANRMHALIAQLLDVARLQAGAPLSLELQSVNLATLVRSVVEEQCKANESLQIQVTCASPEPVGQWDSVRLERVLANLLSNAVKYSPGGGAIAVRVFQECEPKGRDLAVLTVRDSGIGIPAADLPHVFDRFFRGSNVAGRITGSGIGLAGVRQIVHQHGGTIAVESAEGVGTLFTVRLPLEETGDAERGIEGAREEGSGEREE